MRGAERIIRRDHPDLVLEIDRRFTPRFGYQPQELFDFLTGLGYQWQWFADDQLRAGDDVERAMSETNNFRFASASRLESHLTTRSATIAARSDGRIR